MMVRLLLPILGAAVVVSGLLYLGRIAVADRKSPVNAAYEQGEITVDFGVLRRGESAEHRCWLHNSTHAPLAISEFKSSCECLSIASESQVILPGKRTLLTLMFQGDDEFTGLLRVQVEVQGERGQSIGQITAKVEVISAGVSHE